MFGGIAFGKAHFDDVVRLGSSSIRFGESRVIPVEGLGWSPYGLAFLTRVFDNDSHAVAAIVIGQVSHDPHAGMIHLDDGRNAFRSPQPEHGYISRIRHKVAI